MLKILVLHGKNHKFHSFYYSYMVIWIKPMTFIVKITDFPYELSFIQLKQSQII